MTSYEEKMSQHKLHKELGWRSKSPSEYFEYLRSMGLGGRSTIYSSIKNKRQFQTSMKILFQIAVSEKAYQSELRKKLGKKEISYRSLLRHLESLKKIDCIEIDHLEPSSKKGKDKNVWRVTFIGFLLLIKILLEEITSYFSIDYIEHVIEKDPETFERIKKREKWQKYNEKIGQLNNLAKRHPEVLPLIFGKWQFFEDTNIKNRVIYRLSYTRYYLEGYIRKILTTRDLEEQHNRIEDFKRIEKENLEGFLKLIKYEDEADHLSKATENMITALYDLSENPLIIEEDAQETIYNLVFGLAGLIFGLSGPLLDPIKGENYLLTLCKDEEIRKYIDNEIRKRRTIIEKSLKNQLVELDNLKKICKL